MAVAKNGSSAHDPWLGLSKCIHRLLLDLAMVIWNALDLILHLLQVHNDLIQLVDGDDRCGVLIAGSLLESGNR
jgi:hypothetical protein